jgi:tetratricopeptide (TPR) repeat protein
LECVERAIAIDPDYAEAYNCRAMCYFAMAWFGGAHPREMMPKAHTAVLKALALDDNCAAAHASLGVLKATFEYDWLGAGEHFRRALAIDRSLLDVVMPYAIWYLRPTGRFEEALAELEAVRKRDPLSAAVRSDIAWVLLLMRRYESAAKSAREALELEPDYLLAQWHLILAETEQQHYEEAIELAERMVQTAGRWLVPLNYLGYVYAAAGRLADARRVCDEMHEFAIRGHANAVNFGSMHAALGEIDTAMEWLERAIDDREPIATYIKTWASFDSVRSHPGYPALLRKMYL